MTHALSVVRVALLAGVLLLAGSTAVAQVAGDLQSVTDCRYLTTENPDVAFDSSHLGSVWFPEGDLFRPLMADLRQARFYTSGRRVTFRSKSFPSGSDDGTISAGITGIGADFGIWRKSVKRRCNGVRIGLAAAITSQFNLDADSEALINSDFVIGPSVSIRRNRFSARFMVFHQSSHLGDEFILQNPDFDRINLSFEVFDFVASYEGSWWRVYGGGGYLTGARPVIENGIVQWGFELRSPLRRYRTGLTPVFGAHFNSLEARGWNVTTSLAGGIELSNPTGTRRYRVQLAYLAGFIPFGQFFNTERIKNFGFQFQFDY